MIQDSNSSPAEPFVSVIMNCYNSEAYLREAINSIYDQTYTNWEIVFWDNGSSDNSAQIALSYDHRLKYFKTDETSTLGAARNRAVEKTKGELIAFLDCDDIWMANTLKTLVDNLLSTSYNICYAGIQYINHKNQILGEYKPHYRGGYIFSELLCQFDINLQATILRKTILVESNLSFDTNIEASEEYCLFMQLAAKYPFGVISKTVAKYRIHEDSLTNLSIAKWAQERKYTLDIICHEYPNLVEIYSKSFREAYARSDYYKVRYLMFIKDRLGAIRTLAPNVFVNIKYLTLFILLLLPASIWEYIHRIYHRRYRYSLY